MHAYLLLTFSFMSLNYYEEYQVLLIITSHLAHYLCTGYMGGNAGPVEFVVMWMLKPDLDSKHAWLDLHFQVFVTGL